MTDRIDRLEERVAELLRTVDELSDVAAAQAGRIDALERRIALLMQREAEREAEGAGVLPIADRKPPHW